MSASAKKNFKVKSNKLKTLYDGFGRPVSAHALNNGLGGTAGKYYGGYVGAQTDRLLHDFDYTQFNPGTLLMWNGHILRERARNLERNNDLVRRFLELLENNIVGHRGIRMQSKATQKGGRKTLDDKAIEQIEFQWRDWSRAENCSANGMDSLVDFQHMAIRRMAVDGEIFIRRLRGHDNKYRYALQAIESHHVPLGLSNPEQRLYMGIEYDEWGKPLRYHIQDEDGSLPWRNATIKTTTIDADDVLHLFRRERVNQTRGISFLAAPMERLHMLHGIEEAVLVGTRVGASKMGFFRKSSEIGPYSGTAQHITGPDADESENQQLYVDVEPGMFEDIGEREFQSFDPNYPPANYSEYTKSLIRMASSGMGISYHKLANDLSEVNYSTAREAKLDDCDGFRRWQSYLSDKLLNPVWEDWLRMATLTNYDADDFDRLNNVTWQPRGWQWLDPQKEAQGKMTEYEMGITSLTEIAGERGRDLEEILKERKRENELLEKYGVTPGQAMQATTGGDTQPEE